LRRLRGCGLPAAARRAGIGELLSNMAAQTPRKPA
jgi:hypothetical protein